MTRDPHEALDLTVRAVRLQRRGAGRVAVLAAVDQARTSLHHEPETTVVRTLAWVCRAILEPDPPVDTAAVVDAALRVAARTLAPTADPDGRELGR